MNETTKRMLFEKNNRIIEAVRQRAERICPGALDMIAVTGSFASGDYHEKSDLDLLIVIGEEAGYALSHCFILDDVGYDLYCHSWERLAQAAAYESPYVSKLLDAQIVYCREASVKERFDMLSEQLKARLNGPLTEDDCRNANAQLANAKARYFDAMMAGANGYMFPLMGVINALECAVYLLNHAVVRHGVRGVVDELVSMPSLPQDFIQLHGQIFADGSFESHLNAVCELIRNTQRWIDALTEQVYKRQMPDAANLGGTYEELISNYRNKLGLASMQGDHYLSKITLASAQLFFDEVALSVDIGEKQMFDTSDYSTPKTAEDAFLSAMKLYEQLYDKNGIRVCRYADISSFETMYIHGKL